ncbi:hypothetical protein TI05_19285, partial [Achromatium sp. WMS3]
SLKDSDTTDLALLKELGFNSPEQFGSNMLWRIGNMTLLSQKCNVHVGNDAPDLKVHHYGTCTGHPL